LTLIYLKVHGAIFQNMANFVLTVVRMSSIRQLVHILHPSLSNICYYYAPRAGKKRRIRWTKHGKHGID